MILPGSESYAPFLERHSRRIRKYGLLSSSFWPLWASFVRCSNLRCQCISASSADGEYSKFLRGRTSERLGGDTRVHDGGGWWATWRLRLQSFAESSWLRRSLLLLAWKANVSFSVSELVRSVSMIITRMVRLRHELILAISSFLHFNDRFMF